MLHNYDRLRYRDCLTSKYAVWLYSNADCMPGTCSHTTPQSLNPCQKALHVQDAMCTAVRHQACGEPSGPVGLGSGLRPLMMIITDTHHDLSFWKCWAINTFKALFLCIFSHSLKNGTFAHIGDSAVKRTVLIQHLGTTLGTNKSNLRDVNSTVEELN